MKGNYPEAIQLYSRAIELDDTNAIYYSNRKCARSLTHQRCSGIHHARGIRKSNRRLRLRDQVRPLTHQGKFSHRLYDQSYYRKAVALFESPQTEDFDKNCLQTIEQGLATDKDNEDLKNLKVEVTEQYQADHKINVEPEEKARFERLFRWMRKDGAEFDKLKMRYYAPDYRGVHAARDIKKGETILYVPKKEIITLEMAMESPIGTLMVAKNLRNRLLSPKHSFLSCFIMQERRKPQSYFKDFIDILPKSFTNFPIFYSVEER